MSIVEQDLIDKITKKINSKKIKSEYFNDFVHNTASIEASVINNKGLSHQIKFLLERGWTEKDVYKNMPN